MLVRTVRGELPAGEVAVGEVVWSIDAATGQRVAATVVQVRRATRECLALRWQGGSLVCTPDHPLYSPETGAYRPASDWVTGPARTLLISVEDGVRVVAVEGRESFAGMHEVIDLTLDIEPHNFVAAGVVMHNKSPAPDIDTDEQEGPTVELGPGEAARFEIHACADDMDRPELVLEVHVVGKTAQAPNDNVTFGLSVDFDDPDEGLVGTIPFDDSLSDQSAAPCEQGVILTLSRTDAGTSGAIAVSWRAEARTVVETSLGEPEVDSVAITIEPLP
jgi:hypothetical protein